MFWTKSLFEKIFPSTNINIYKFPRLKMGNLADKICENKYEFAIGSFAFALGAFSLYHRYETDELRKIANSMDPYIPLV